MSRLPLRLALAVVRAVSWLVPRAARRDWHQEWEAELRHHATELQRRRRPAWRARIRLVTRAMGTVPDAAWIRRQFTLDADAVHDAAHGARMLVKAPGFSLVVLAMFAVGIGAATAIVSLADALFLRPLAVPRPERVMTVWQANRETGERRLDVAPANALDWLARARSFESLAVVEPFTFNLNVDGREPDYVAAARVSEQFFTALGTPVLHGRAFLPGEHRRGGPRVVLVSHALWVSRFGADPAVVGTAVRLDPGDAYTVAGVLAPGLELRLFNDRDRRPEPAIWMPKQGYEPFELTLRAQAYWNVIGRLRPGISSAAAQAEFDAISSQLARQYPSSNLRTAAEVVPLRTHLAGSLRGVLPLLLGAAGLLLIVACANIGSLMVARGATRTREFAVRQALGASRWRLVRQMLVESVLLAAAGGVAGLLLARWSLDTIAGLRPGDLALVDRIPIDVRSALIAGGVTLLAAIAAGLAPAAALSRPAAAGALRQGSTGSRRRLHRALVVGEVASAVVLAVGTGLLVRSYALVQRVDPGFTRDHVTVLQVFASRRVDTPQKRVAFFEQALDRIRALPGVAAAGGVTSMPFGEARVIVRVPVAVAGRPAAAGEQALAYASAVSGEYFAAMNVPLVSGRLFGGRDRSGAPQVAILSRAAAQRFFHGRTPLGSRVRLRFNGLDHDAEVVGIVGDVRHESLDAPAAPEVFLPYAQSGFYGLTLVVRAVPGASPPPQALKAQVWALDPQQAIYDTARLDDLIAKTLVGRRFNLVVLGSFAVITLILAAAGVHGLVSFSASQRTREFGVRLALGAARRDIVRLVVGEGMMLTALGVAIGVLVSLPLARLLQSLLFGVTTTDPLTFVTVAVVLILASALACCLPAHRALGADPAGALRFD